MVKLHYPSLLILLVVATSVGAQPDRCPEERQRAAAVRDRIERDWPLRYLDAVTDLIDGFGYELAVRSGIARVSDWRFRVVQDTSINAYSIGDGQIYITEGAIVAAADDSELAAILAHEMGHDIAGHLCPRAEKPGESPWWDVFSPSSESSSSGSQDLSYYGNLRQVIDPAKEREANKNAAIILRKAGYDPHAIHRVEQRIARQSRAYPRTRRRSHLSYLGEHQQQHWNNPDDPTHAVSRSSSQLQAIQQRLRNDHS